MRIGRSRDRKHASQSPSRSKQTVTTGGQLGKHFQVTISMEKYACSSSYSIIVFRYCKLRKSLLSCMSVEWRGFWTAVVLNFALLVYLTANVTTSPILYC